MSAADQRLVAAAAPGACSLHAPPSSDVAAVSATCRARILEREGIAMFLALHDARPGRQLRVTGETALAEGRRLAVLFDHYRDGLAAVGVPDELRSVGIEGDTTDASPADLDPTGAAELIDILVVLSDQHLRARPETSENGGS